MRFKWGGGGIRSSNRSIIRASQGVIEPLQSRRLLAVVPTTGFSGTNVDGNFGTNGLVRVDAYDQDTAQSLVIQGDGKIVVAGWSGPRTSDPGMAGNTLGTSISVIRLTSNGSLDETFGTGGIVNIPFSGAGTFYQYDPLPIAQLDDGSFVVGGPGVRHLSSSGALDSDFAGGGAVANASGLNRVVDLDVSDGKIVAMDDHFDLARFNADGTIDSSFGTSGVAAAPSVLSSGGGITSFRMFVQADGKPVAVGDQSPAGLTPIYVTLLRLNADGTPDTSFGGGDGAVITQPPASDNYIEGQAIAPASNGRIVVAGRSQNSGQLLLRYLPDGQLDSTFGQGGMIEYPDANVDNSYDVAVDSQDRMTVASDGDSLTVFRYNADGSLDTTFAPEGFARSLLPNVPTGAQNTIALALQDDGKIVVLGQDNLQDGDGHPNTQDASDFYIYRLGTPDVVPPDPVRLVGTRLEIDGTTSNDTITLEHSGNNIVVHRNGTDTSFDFAGVDLIVINGQQGDDVISAPVPIECRVHGDDGNDSITTGSGDDQITTGHGNDTVHAGAGDDLVITGVGAFDPDSKTFFGEDGDDSLQGSGGPDTLIGGAGRDVLIGFGGADYLSGGGGKDKISGVGGNDRLRGGAGDDQLDGGTGNNRIFGDDGNDKLFASRGASLIDAGPGNDFIFTFPDSNKDTIDGGDGSDMSQGAGADELTNVETVVPLP